MVRPIEPRELARRLSEGEPIRLLDVREPQELALASLGEVVHIPLGELVARADELDPDDPTPLVCVCHHGIRSAQAAGYLEAQGLGEVYNLSGGVDRWSLEVDPTLPRY